jgi:hypothetical protein
LFVIIIIITTLDVVVSATNLVYKGADRATVCTSTACSIGDSYTGDSFVKGNHRRPGSNGRWNRDLKVSVLAGAPRGLHDSNAAACRSICTKTITNEIDKQWIDNDKRCLLHEVQEKANYREILVVLILVLSNLTINLSWKSNSLKIKLILFRPLNVWYIL